MNASNLSLNSTIMEDEDQFQEQSVQNNQNQTPAVSSNSARSPNFMSLVHHKWRKMLKRDSAEITASDPSYKSIYLGNVVTTWAKGEGCLERPASALWKNHCQGRGSIKMLISVAPSGLKANTREHGLTEYWANRLTWCGVPPDYPKLFCWIYRHEGRKLKQELRCHAVLCSKEVQAQRLASCLKNRLTEALFDFKKEKILRQNARLSLVQNLYSGSATKRKLVLMNSNSQNYKPPLERSKSAPKLSCIEEFEEEENEENFAVDSHMTIPEADEHHETLSVPCPLRGDEQQQASIESGDLSTSKSPVTHRKSYPAPAPTVIHHPEGARRPHTVPIDAKLNLPYMTGYDKVMHLLGTPTDGERQHILDGEDDEFSFNGGPNSDPVASSPGSDASESVLDSIGDDELRMRRRDSCERKQGQGGDEDEINDNVSDESGYSEEATVVTSRCVPANPNGTGLNHHHSSPSLTKKSKSSSQSTKSTTTTFKSDVNGGPPTSSTSTTLVVYDNLCFEI